MVAQPQPPRWTVDAYLTMERGSPIRHEYINGHVYAMAGGTRRHSRISVTITAALEGLLANSSCQVFNSDMLLRVDDTRYVYPDACVSCDPRDTGDDTPAHISHPTLIVEILSDDSTAGYDRGDKFTLLYQRIATLQEYVLVETGKIGVEVYRRDDDGEWPRRAYGPGEDVPLESIGLTLPIAAFYGRVAL